MRAAALALFLALAATGCRSSHDYLSLNREGLSFFNETAAQGIALDRENLRRDFAVFSRARENLYQDREGLRFFNQSFFGDQWSRFLRMVDFQLEDLKQENSDVGWEMRFGFLDSGD